MTQSTASRISLRIGGYRLILFGLTVLISVFIEGNSLAAKTSPDTGAASDITAVNTNSYAEATLPSAAAAASSTNPQPAVSAGAANITAMDTAEQRIIERCASSGEKKSTATSPKARPASPSGGRTILALIAVLGLVGLAALAARRFLLRSRKTGNVKLVDIIARTSIGSRQSLCLVRLADRLLLVGLSPNHMAALDVIDDPEAVARLMGEVARQSSNSISNGFSNLFQREARQFDLAEEETLSEDTFGEEANSSLSADSGWRRARGELTGLLNKVKGLSRLHWR